MFQNFLNNFSRNVNKTKDQLVKNLNKELLKQKYFKLLNDPKIQRITKVSPEEYKQQMNFLKQSYSNKKKELQKELDKLKQRKPEEIFKQAFKNKDYLNRLNLEKNKEKLKQKLDTTSWKLRNFYENGNKYFKNFASQNKEKFNGFKSKETENLNERRNSKSFENLNANKYFGMLKEKAYFFKDYANRQLKSTTYRLIFYFVSFIFMIKFFKYLLNKLFGRKDSKDEKYDQIIKQLNELQRQNEELRLMNQRLLDSKFK